MAKSESQNPATAERAAGEYVVVARRYRPQTFDELIGQEHVARALKNAIAANRVGHAYLFTGARGVGKTSAARILAKALDCQFGPTATPCNQCDICQSISAGSDVDVLEIDGASNRGIDEIRQLRQNVNIRPARARFKIYIIDEVHMLTREAFNALLKTLEEPPEHVKFIFCTTEPTKIPITILSRCQRFDFAGIRSTSIAERLKQIVEAEGVKAEQAALELLARRANGSMRDSQSLLEQLLSFGETDITVADVHAMLGTAADARLGNLVARLAARDPAGALTELDRAIAEGVEPGLLVEQLVGFLRDAMAAAVGCDSESFLYASGDQVELVRDTGQQLGLETILAAIQILDQTLARMRYSTQSRTLVEMAVVRLSSLENLAAVRDLVESLQSGAGPRESGAGRQPPEVHPRTANPLAAEAAKKKEVAGPDKPHSAAASQERSTATQSQQPAQLTESGIESLWGRVLELLPPLLSTHASFARPTLSADEKQRASTGASSAPPRLVVTFPAKYNSSKSFCERMDQLSELERVIAECAGGAVKIELALTEEDRSVAEVAARPAQTKRQRMAEKADHPLVRRATELFGGELVDVD